jgi:iron(III) transport system substrate-binding protein
MVMKRSARILGLAAALAGFAALWVPAQAAELPRSTQKMLQDLKFDAAILDGIDEELAVPAEWLELARKEGQFTIAASEDEPDFRAYIAPFVERYPFIKVIYQQGSYGNRVTRPLLAFKQGRYLTDITTSFTGTVHLFNEVKALASLSDVPNFHNVREQFRPDNAEWTGHDLRLWCMGYNPKKIKKEWLPTTWEGILDSKELRGDMVGVNDRSMTWVAQLWNFWGPEKTTQFLEKFFANVKPQLRKEGVSALTQLTSLGEVPVAIPVADYRVFEFAGKGGDIAWHCPDPIPVSISEIGLIRGTPNAHAAKIFINWLLSREGQIAKYSVIFTPPVHKALPLEKFLVYPNEVAGKALAPINANKADDQNEEVQKVWVPLWEKSMREKK